MMHSKVISCNAEELSALLDGFSAEKGVLGSLPSMANHGRFFGLIEANKRPPRTLENSYHGSRYARESTMGELFIETSERLRTTCVLIQDIWAQPSDYAEPILKGTPILTIESSIYVAIDTKHFSSSLRDALARLVSSMAVVIFLSDCSTLNSTRAVLERAFVVAIEAFDGEGWLVWARNNSCGESLVSP